MSRVSIFKSLTDTVPHASREITQVLKAIKSGVYSKQVAAVRSEPDKKRRDQKKKQLLAVTFSGEFAQRKADGLTKHSGFIVLDFDDVPDIDGAKKSISADEYVYAVFISPSGNGLKVLVKIDGTKHQQSFKQLAAHFKERQGLTADESGKDVSRLCFVSYDPDIYLNENSKTFIAIDEPKPLVPLASVARLQSPPAIDKTQMQRDARFALECAVKPLQSARNGTRHSTNTKVSTLIGGYIAGGFVDEFEATDVLKTIIIGKFEPQRHSEELRTMRECIAHGKRQPISYEDWVRNRADYTAGTGQLVEVAQLPKGDVLQSTATNIEPTAKRAAVKKSSAANAPVNVEVKPSKIAEIEAFLSRRYEFRFNVVTGKIEFRSKEQTLDGDAKPIEGTPFKVATEYDMNSLERELLHNSLPARSLTKLLSSDFVPTFNPFTDFLDGLPQWNGERDFIREFFNATVKVKLTDGEDSQSIAAEYFRKWLVATVSTWRGTGNIREINQTMLIFTGAQGRGKTTWQLNLMPEALREYVYAGHFDASNRDNLVLLADKALIVFDELDSLNRGGEAAFKQAISKSFITARRAYGRSNEDYPRRASFIGSINHTEFLGDTTGTRRFLTVEVESIDNEFVRGFPLEMIYAQAKAMLASGFQYWFDSGEMAALNKRNEQYANISVEEDLILQHFDAGDVFYTPTAIVEALSAKYKSVRINAVAIGKVLKKHGFERIKKRQGEKTIYGYLGRLSGLGEAFPQGGDPF